MRNGYCPTTVKTTAGPVTLQRPKLRGTTERFASQLFGKRGDQDQRPGGAGDRRVRARAVDPRRGGRAGRGARRGGGGVEVDGVAGLRPRSRPSSRRGAPAASTTSSWTTCSWTAATSSTTPTPRAEPVLAAWGIDTDGKPVFVGLDGRLRESGDAWAGFLTGLGERGLACPLLVISDGAPGLIGAVERTMGAALRQRCLIHRARNVLAKVPKNAQAEVKADYWAIFDLPEDVEPGPDAVANAQARIDAFATRWRDSYPAAVRCLLDDRDSLTVYLRFPREHWTRVRHSNFIERTFGETRRRVKVIGRLPGEHSCLSLVWAVLDRASAGWRGFTMTPAGLRLLQDLRRNLHDPPTPLPQRNSKTTAETGIAPTDSTAIA